MKKFLLAMVLGVSAITSAWAATLYKSVVVNKTDDTFLQITMEQDMTTRFEDGELVLTCSLGDVKIPVEEVRNLTFSTENGQNDLWLGIDIADADAVNVDIVNNRAIFSNLPEGSHISLTAIDGRVVKSATAAGDYEFAFGQLTQGVYILTYNNHSLKIAITR